MKTFRISNEESTVWWNSPVTRGVVPSAVCSVSRALWFSFFSTDRALGGSIWLCRCVGNAMHSHKHAWAWRFEAARTRQKRPTVPRSLSPLFTIVFELGFLRMYGQNVPTYESGSLRRFHHGRTDTIRSCSQESAVFCRVALDEQVPASERARLLRLAVSAHSKYTEEVCGCLKIRASAMFRGVLCVRGMRVVLVNV